MSHFTVLVLTNGEKTVEELLAPFDENLEVEEYEVECYCVGKQAEREVQEEADKKFGTWVDMKAKFAEKYPRNSEEHSNDMTLEKRQQKWTEEFRNPRKEYENELVKEHPLYNKPNPDCGKNDEDYKYFKYEYCSGTGKCLSCYNPKSKWDWYQKGGRWFNGLYSEAEMLDIYDGNRRSTSELLKLHNNGIEKLCVPTFAVVTPDGEWIEKGKMGW